MEQDFEYINKEGGVNTFKAVDSNTALANMPQNADPQSGVRKPPAVVSSKPAYNSYVKESTNLQKSLNSMQAPSIGTSNTTSDSDPYTLMLDRLSISSDNATKALIGTIQAQRTNQGNQIEGMYDNYKRGLQALGIQQNKAVATGDLLLGQIKRAENEKLQKLTELDINMNKALMDAQFARDEKQLGVLKEKMSYVKELKKERDNYLRNIADQMTAQQTIADFQAVQIYDELQKIPANQKEAFIAKVAEQYGISPMAIIEGVRKASEGREDRAFEVNKRTKELNKSTSGSGTTRRYTASNIPQSIMTELQNAFKEIPDISLDELYEVFPEVSVSFLNTTHGKLGKKDAKSQFESMTPAFKDERLKKKNIFTKGKLANLAKLGIDTAEVQSKYEEGFSMAQIAKGMGLNQSQYQALEKATKK